MIDRAIDSYSCALGLSNDLNDHKRLIKKKIALLGPHSQIAK
mgnify:CR=1 FL=1